MDYLPLLKILADGEFHSGEDLGRSLEISRTAIWKQIKNLKGLGIELQSVTGKGYRLVRAMELLDRDLIYSHLSPKGNAREVLAPDLVNSCFDLHFTIDSTNVAAMTRAREGAERFLVIAEHQSQGRGRRGRDWVSPCGRNLYLSLVWSFQSGVGGLEGLSLLAALIVVRALQSYGFEGAQVKWPNDILLNGKKMAGILIEVNGDVTGPCSVVIGIGLNIDMPEVAGVLIDQPYTDLTRGFGQRVDRNRLGALLIDELFSSLAEFASSGFAPFRREWENLDRYRGQTVEVRTGSRITVGVAQGVSNSGALMLETPDGPVSITGGEVFPSLRPVEAD